MVSKRNAYKAGKIRLDNEAVILKSAEREFAARGFNGASMNRIAEGAGVPRTNVHYYFTRKSDLYGKVLTDIVDLWDEAFNQISPDDDPATAIGAYIHAKVMYSKTNPLASKVFASEILHGAPQLSKYLRKDYRSWMRQKAKVIDTWVEQGKMDPVDPFYLIFLIWASTQHYADFAVQVTSVLGKKKLAANDFDAIANNLCHIVLKGCGIKTSRSYLNR